MAASYTAAKPKKPGRNVLAVPDHDGLPLVVALLTDILQPLLGKGVQIPVQLGNPLAGFRVDLLINLNRAVLPEGQRFQGPLLPVRQGGGK